MTEKKKVPPFTIEAQAEYQGGLGLMLHALADVLSEVDFARLPERVRDKRKDEPDFSVPVRLLSSVVSELIQNVIRAREFDTGPTAAVATPEQEAALAALRACGYGGGSK